MAIVMPLLLLLIFGIIEFGLLLTAQISVTEAAREGARAATVDRDPSAARDRVQLLNSEFDIDAGESNGCGSNPAPGDDAVIVVTYRHEFLTPLGGLMGMMGGGAWGDSIDVSATGVMPCRA
jgi:Flp pilus assembly protein TadG